MSAHAEPIVAGVAGVVRNLLRGIGTNLSLPSLNFASRHLWRLSFCSARRMAMSVRCCSLSDNYAAGMTKHASKSEQLAVRIEPALRAALEAAAASDRRPVSQYVRNLILDAVDGDRERPGERVAR